MIHIEDEHLKILKSILKQSPVTFYVFGSRAKGVHKKFSDLDLCFKGNMPNSILYKIQEELINSNLPFKVDIVNFNQCSKEFQQIMEKEMIPLNLS